MITLSRDLTRWVHFIFDQCLPPLLRDSKWFMWLPFKLLFKDKAEIFFSFKERAPHLSAEEFREIYARAAPVFIQRDTDLNQDSVEAIMQQAVGKTVLDIACGRGYLCRRLAGRGHEVTGADIVIDPALVQAHPEIRFQQANLEALPFPDAAFDTVICAHTLEHVQNPQQAINELRRVCAGRLIIVVPRQRPYRFTFDLHLHFFPYAVNLLSLLGDKGKHWRCRELGGDWFYLEDRHFYATDD